MRLALALLLVASSLSGAGHPLAPPSYGMSPYSVSEGGTATNGTTFLTVWKHWTPGNGTTIFGVFAGANGSITTPSFEILTIPNVAPNVFLYLSAPVATADGYVLVWSTATTVEMARLTDAGAVRDRRVLDLPGLTFGHLIGSGNQIFLDVQTANRGGFGYLFDTSGAILLRDIPLPGSNLDRHVTALPDGFALTMREHGVGIWTERIARDGTFGKRIEIAPAVDSGWPQTASHGSTLAIAWSSYPNMWLATVDANGNVKRMVVGGGSPPSTYPPDSLSRVAAGWVLFTRGDLALIADDGRVIATAPTNWSFSAEVAANDTTIYAMSTELVSVQGFYQIRVVSKAWEAPTLRRVANDGISRTLAVHDEPVIVQMAGGQLVAWHSRSLASHAIEAAALLPGEKSVRTVYEHGRTNTADGIDAFAMATNGAQSLVVWSDNRRVYGRILDPNGGPLGDKPFLIALNVFRPLQVEWTGSQWIVAWLDDIVTTVRVSTTGDVSNSLRVRPKTLTGGLGGLDLAWNGTHLLALGMRGRSSPDPIPATGSTDHRAILFRLDANGALAGDEHLELPRPQRRASLSSDGKDWLVVSDEGGGPTATVVSADFRVGTTTPLFAWAGEYASNVAWNGSEYVAAVRYSRDGAHFIGMHRLSRGGVPTTVPVVGSVGAHDELRPPSVAGNVAVFSAFNTGEAARATAVTPADLAFVAPPAPPRNMRIVATGKETIDVAWDDASDDERGFVIERLLEGRWIVSGSAPANATHGTATATAGTLLRVRSWNAGGASELVSIPRRRSSH
jgi:hypothetical protein